MSDILHSTVEPICFGNHGLVNEKFWNYLHIFVYYNGEPDGWVHGYIFREDFPFCKKCYLNELIMIDQHIIHRTVDDCDIWNFLILECVDDGGVKFYKLIDLDRVIIQSNIYAYNYTEMRDIYRTPFDLLRADSVVCGCENNNNINKDIN